MADIQFIAAHADTHRAELIELNVEYVSWVFAEIEKLLGEPADQVVGMPARDYVPTVIDKVCGDAPPKGIFYLVTVDGRLAGMGGLRALSTSAAEVKRVYFRPAVRGLKLGQAMLDRLLADAKAFGYAHARLDTAPFMTAAQRLYERNGFVDRPAYDGVELPQRFHRHWRFMERSLRADA